MPPPLADLGSMTRDELSAWFIAQNESAFRGRQVFRWLHGRLATSFEEMTDLSKSLRERLAGQAGLHVPQVVEEQVSRDGTRKFGYRLPADGRFVEGVFIPDGDRKTLCVSTQVGCGMDCAFCATASMGFVRNLTAGEIAGQIGAATRHLIGLGLATAGERFFSNLVFMGMGEPLANLDAVVTAIDILLDDHGPAFSRRHVTVSTAGLVPQMEEFVHRSPAKLAVSLNATTDAVRNRVMPVNRRYPLAALLDCCRHLPIPARERITFEYVLLADTNDSPQDARRLVGLLAGIPAKVNLIPFNPHSRAPFARPTEQAVERFQEILAGANVTVLLRKSKGLDLQGACGQLVVDPKHS